MRTNFLHGRARILGLALTATLVTPGCGSSNLIWVSGKVLKAGAPFTCPDDRRLAVVFIALEIKDEAGKNVANDEPDPAHVNPADATFSVPGPDGFGIPPGRYRVSLTLNPTAAAVAAAQAKAVGRQKTINRETDYFARKFSPASSPIIRDLQSSGEVTIDLDRPTEGKPAAP